MGEMGTRSHGCLLGGVLHVLYHTGDSRSKVAVSPDIRKVWFVVDHFARNIKCVADIERVQEAEKMITLDNFVSTVTFIASIVALYFSIRKQKHEENKSDADVANLDADTIGKLYDLIDKQDVRYNALSKEFEAYKVNTNAQIADVVNENVKLRRWAKKLAAQLEQAGIVPAQY